jgi:SAM-dependent methyltransferase
VREELLALLRCPACGSRLTLQRGSDGRSIVSGILVCDKCSEVYQIRDSIPRFVRDDGYAKNFSLQWNLHPRTQLDTDGRRPSEEFLRRATGFSPEVVRGKLVLDAGCGAGRYAEVISRWGGEVAAVDLSYAVDACGINLSRRDNVHVVQSDLLGLPFSEQLFDVVFSVGVLHHTPDPRAAFFNLVRYVKPGGQIAIWVYDAYQDQTIRLKLSRAIRRVTTRFPPGLLYAACHLAVPLGYLNRVPLARSFTGRLWHISDHPEWRWRVLDTFDWYSCRYQSHHTYPEVFRWFREAGLLDVEVLEPPVALRGVKPAELNRA